MVSDDYMFELKYFFKYSLIFFIHTAKCIEH